MMNKMPIMVIITLSEALPSLPPPGQPHQGATPPEHNFRVLKIHLRQRSLQKRVSLS